MSPIVADIVTELGKLAIDEAPLVLQMLKHANSAEGETARRQALVAGLLATEESILKQLYPAG